MNQVDWAPVAMNSFQRRIREMLSSISRRTTFGHCACIYARAGLVAYLWCVENRCERRKKMHIICCVLWGEGRQREEETCFILSFLRPPVHCLSGLCYSAQSKWLIVETLFSIQTTTLFVVFASTCHCSTLPLSLCLF